MNDKELLSWLEKATMGDESAFQLVYQATGALFVNIGGQIRLVLGHTKSLQRM